MTFGLSGFSNLKSSFYEIKTRFDQLNSEEQKLVLRHPIDAYKVNQAKNSAIAVTQDTFGGMVPDTASDAFRHCIWQKEATELVGEVRAKQFGDAHELNTDNLAAAHAMDFHNNAVGRSLAGHGALACQAALDAGDLIVLK